MYTIVILVLFTKTKLISSVDNVTIFQDGIARALGIWPLRSKQQNMVVSTFPLRLALNKLAAAAEGEAKEQLLTALGITDVKNLTNYYPQLEKKIQCLRDSDMIMLNKIFVHYSDDVAPSFFADSYKTFGVLAEKIHFEPAMGIVSYVNQWVDSVTFKRITDLLSVQDIQSVYNMILVNALHMKPTWEKPFDIRLSVMKSFHIPNKDKIELRMMTALEKLFFFYRDYEHKFKVLMVYLTCDGSRITFFLPDEVAGLPKLLKLFIEKPEVMKNAVKKLKMDTINVQLPVMKIKGTINWKHYLRGLGIKKIFDHESSGLDSMSESSQKTNYFLGKIVQKVFVEIDEFGIYRQPPDRPVEIPDVFDKVMVQHFTADHPFFFKVEIQDSEVFHELLSGVFYGTDE